MPETKQKLLSDGYTKDTLILHSSMNSGLMLLKLKSFRLHIKTNNKL